MAFILSSNMNLPIPGVGTESGPQYAFDVNSSLTLIDQHDHSPGRGIQVTPAGLNISSNLTFQGNAATNLGYESFQALTSATSVIQALSVAPASSINELFYTDSNGSQTQITKNGVVNATASSIPGESYDAGTFIWVQGAGSTTPANFDIGSITLRPNTAGTTNGVVVSPPSGISSQYNIQLPLIPSVTNLMSMDNTGVISANVNVDNSTLQLTSNTLAVKNGGITTTQIASNAAIAPSQIDSITSGTWVYTATSSGTQTGIFTSATQVTNQNISITNFTLTRPVFISVQGGSLENSATPNTNTATYTLEATNGLTASTLATFTFGCTSGAGPTNITIPASAINYVLIDPIILSTFSQIRLLVQTNSSTTVTITNIKLQAVQV